MIHNCFSRRGFGKESLFALIPWLPGRREVFMHQLMKSNETQGLSDTPSNEKFIPLALITVWLRSESVFNSFFFIILIFSQRKQNALSNIWNWWLLIFKHCSVGTLTPLPLLQDCLSRLHWCKSAMTDCTGDVWGRQKRLSKILMIFPGTV